MLSEDEFRNIITQPESSILDFKACVYNLQLDKDLKQTSKFVKDLICMANTVRNESAYIIFGIEEKPDNEKKMHGITEMIDDAVFQDKIKDKAFPVPVFSFYTINYLGKKFGIIEVPINKYIQPIYPKVKLPGLDIGRIYFRRGTMNDEAIGHEVININNWLASLPSFNDQLSVNDEISRMLKDIASGKEKLSILIAELLQIAKRFNLKEIISFCSFELKGITQEDINLRPDDYKYRIIKVKISYLRVDVNHYSFNPINANAIKNEMNQDDHFFDYNLLLNQSISTIEDCLVDLNSESFFRIQKSSKAIFPDRNVKEYPAYIYLFKDNYSNLYRSIRQKLIDKLMSF